MSSVRRLAVDGEGTTLMMLRFQWDSLRRGDRILARDGEQADVPDRPADSTVLAPGMRGEDVPTRHTDGADAGQAVRRRRFAAEPADAYDQTDRWPPAEMRTAA